MRVGTDKMHSIPLEESVRWLSGALLLTAGYYASRVPAIGEFLRRLG